MYNTLIAGGGLTLSFLFVVHLQDVWRRFNGALFCRCLYSLLIQAMDSIDILAYANVLHKSNKLNYYKQLFTKRLENKDAYI